MTPLRALRRSTPALPALAAVAAGLLALAASVLIGPAGLLAPLAIVGAVILLARPRLALGVLVSFVVLCEGDGSGLAPGIAQVYEPLAAGVSAVDLLLALAAAAVALDIVRRGDTLRVPAVLAVPLGLLVLAIAAGVVTGYARGASPVDMLYEGRSPVYLAVVPVIAVNAVRTQAHVVAGLALVAVLTVTKAALGLLAFAIGAGTLVEGSTITYYEPLANLLMLTALIAVVAAVLLRDRARMPVWLLLASPFMLACFVLSFRRSFWIGFALGVVLVVVLAMSPVGRRMVAPIGVVLAAGVWALGTVGFQAQGPIVERVESLKPSKIAANAEDRYRLDERANVLAELRASPIAGLGLAVEWSSAARALPVEHENGRRYVHVVALWHWLKLGVLGLLAYVAVLAASLIMAWRVWRGHPDPLLRTVGLTMLCAFVALAAVETTGSFTGVENRVSIALGAALGLLAVAGGAAHAPGRR